MTLTNFPFGIHGYSKLLVNKYIVYVCELYVYENKRFTDVRTGRNCITQIFFLRGGRWTEWAKLIELTLLEWPKNKSIETVKQDENNVIHSSFDGLTNTWLPTRYKIGNAIAVVCYNEDMLSNKIAESVSLHLLSLFWLTL